MEVGIFWVHAGLPVCRIKCHVKALPPCTALMTSTIVRSLSPSSAAEEKASEEAAAPAPVAVEQKVSRNYRINDGMASAV